MSTITNEPWSPDSVRNMDVVGIVERWDKYAYELFTSESATLNSINQYDMDRILQYNAALRTYVDTINDSVMMDLPHSTPAMYNIKYLTQGLEYDNVKNKAIRDLIRLYVNGWLQWSRSESADKSNGFYDFDYNRFVLIMDRIDQFIAAYIEQATPQDQPESSNYSAQKNQV